MLRVATISLLLLALCTTQATCLVCYRCSGCLRGVIGFPVVCSRWQDACLKVTMGPWVTKGCTTSSSCTLSNLQSVVTGLVNAATNDLSQATYRKEVNCCRWSFCNAGRMSVPTAVLTLLAPMLLCVLLQ